LNNKTKHDHDGPEPPDPHELEKWADRYEMIRLWRHLLDFKTFKRSELGELDVWEVTVELFCRVRLLVVLFVKHRRRGD
jgi:hypothetical protein